MVETGRERCMRAWYPRFWEYPGTKNDDNFPEENGVKNPSLMTCMACTGF